MLIDLSSGHLIGTVVRLDDQEFELVGETAHTRLDGSKTTLLIWRAECPSCGDPFELTSPVKTSGLSRRCAKCAKPGKPVKGKRGRRVAIEVVEP